MLLVAFVKTLFDDYNPDNSYTVLNIFGVKFGGIFAISVGSLILGVILMFITERFSPAFFRGEVLTRETPVRVLEDGAVVPPPVLVLPDAPSLEHTVIPPMSEEELQEAERRAREERRD